MAAVRQNLIIEQGATFSFNINWIQSDEVTPVDLTGYTARMQVRESVDATSILLSFTTENGRIILGDAAGTIQLDLGHIYTEVLLFEEGVYDLELISGAPITVTRLIYGGVEVRPEVTR